MINNSINESFSSNVETAKSISFFDLFSFFRQNISYRSMLVIKLGDTSLTDHHKIAVFLKKAISDFVDMSSTFIPNYYYEDGTVIFLGEGRDLSSLKDLLLPLFRSLQALLSSFSMGDLKITSCLLNDESELSDRKSFDKLIHNLTDPVYQATKEELCKSAVKSFKFLLIESTRETANHCERISLYNNKVAKRLDLMEQDVYLASLVGWLHDIGKVVIEDAVLDKPDKLTIEEMSRMCEHTTIGYRIIRPIQGLEEVALGIRHHHEYFNGKGYPDKIAGKSIPLFSRIVSVSDAFDTMLSKRVYKESQTLEYAVSELERCKGTQFDPEIVKVFLELLSEGEFDEILKTYYN